MAIWKRNKTVAFKEVEEAEVEEIGDNTYMTAEIETVLKVDAAVPILGIVLSQGLQCSKLDLCCVTVLLHGANDLDGD
jgi:hypothetical protein